MMQIGVDDLVLLFVSMIYKMALITYMKQYKHQEKKSMIFNFKYIKGHYDSTLPESIAELQNQVIENVKNFLKPRRQNQIR